MTGGWPFREMTSVVEIQKGARFETDIAEKSTKENQIFYKKQQKMNKKYSQRISDGSTNPVWSRLSAGRNEII